MLWKCSHLGLVPQAIHPPPPQVLSILENIYKIYNLQVYSQACALVTTDFAGNPEFHANWKPQILPK